MSNEVTAFGNAKLPAVATIAARLKRNVENIASVGGCILKFDKSGSWVFGPNADETEEGAEWAVNPYSFVHGYIAWGEGAPTGEVMGSMTEDLPEVGSVPPGTGNRGWEHQVGVSLKCLTGEDKGMEVRYASSSTGGKRAMQALGLAVAEQIGADQSRPVAIVTLEADSYKHSSYGKVHVPVFDIVRFVGLDGPVDADAGVSPPPVEAEQKTAATSRRRRS